MSYDPYPIIGSHAPEAIEFGRKLVNGKRTGRLRYGGGNHVLIFGKSGSGKDTRLLIPNLLRMHGKRSIVCVDPKGEMAACTAHHRAKFGRVFILNPFGVLSTEYQGHEFMAGRGYNPLAGLNPWSPEFNVDAGLMAEALIPMSANEKNPFFPLSARALVGGLIMLEVCKAKEQGRVPLLGNVRRMICEAAQEATPAKIIGGAVVKDGVPAKGIPAYAMEMVNSVILGMRNKGGQFVDWNKSTMDVAKTAMSETEFLDDLPMSLNVARNDFDFNEVKERPTTVFLCLPMKVVQRHGKWLRMLLTAALQACMRPRAENEPSTLFILNEFAAMGHLQLIEDNFTVVRGAGIQMMPILQDLNQMKQLYDKRWETFIANSDVTATFAPNDITTAEWFSKRCGETVRPKVAVSKSWTQNSGSTQNQGTSPGGGTSGTGTSGGWSFNQTENHSLEKVPFLAPSDLYRMEAGEMRIIAAGEADTIHAHAMPYWKMSTIAALAFPNPYAPDAKLKRIPQIQGGGQFGPLFRQKPDGDDAWARSRWNPENKTKLPSPPPPKSNPYPNSHWGFLFEPPDAAEPKPSPTPASGKPSGGFVDDPRWDNGGDARWEDNGGWDEPPSPAPEQKRLSAPEPRRLAKPPTRHAPEPDKPLHRRVLAKHPSYTPEPSKTLPAPLKSGRKGKPDDGEGSEWEYINDA